MILTLEPFLLVHCFFWTLGGFCLAEIWRFFVFRTFQMCCKGILMKVYCIDLQPQCSVAPMDMAEWKHQNRLTWPTFIGDCLKVHFKAYFPTENIVVLIWSGWNLSCAVELCNMCLHGVYHSRAANTRKVVLWVGGIFISTEWLAKALNVCRRPDKIWVIFFAKLWCA